MRDRNKNSLAYGEGSRPKILGRRKKIKKIGWDLN
jgi:hypothetical protein